MSEGQEEGELIGRSEQPMMFIARSKTPNPEKRLDFSSKDTGTLRARECAVTGEVLSGAKMPMTYSSTALCPARLTLTSA